MTTIAEAIARGGKLVPNSECPPALRPVAAGRDLITFAGEPYLARFPGNPVPVKMDGTTWFFVNADGNVTK